MQNEAVSHGIIEAPVDVRRIERTYDRMSGIYFLFAPLEEKARMRGITLAQIKQTDKVLEVAVGIGLSFLEILKRVSRDNSVCGIDLSKAMLEKTKKRALRHGYAHFDLRQADARKLPFPDGTFDVLYNSYMLDLIPLRDLPEVLREFHRVLKPGGRIVLVNLSKREPAPIFYERLYQLNPYFWGGCRPVLMKALVGEAGFLGVQREVLRFTLLPGVVSEIVAGTKA